MFFRIRSSEKLMPVLEFVRQIALGKLKPPPRRRLSQPARGNRSAFARFKEQRDLERNLK